MPTDYRPRLLGRLTGISDRVLDQHIGLYERYLSELGDIAAAYPRVSWTAPPEAAGIPPGAVSQLLETPIARLQLALEGNRLGTVLGRLRAETQAAGLAFWPAFYLGTDDFWTTNYATSINVPWFLGSDETWAIVAARETAYTDDDVLRILRHEYAHALGYAFEGWKDPRWARAFGDMAAPYLDRYDPDPALAGNFVAHLHRPGAASLLHYAQKHPDEDWAETFAVWLAGGWQDAYPAGAGARAKLEAVDELVRGGVFYGPPRVTARGRTEPFTAIPGTVGEYLGQGQEALSLHAALLRREPEVFAAVTLHESYFEALAPGQTPGEGLRLAAQLAYGSFEAWALDLRAIGGSTSGWGLVVWDRRAARLRNVLVRGHADGVPPSCEVVAAMDVWEHAYAGDYDTSKHLYLGAFFRNLAWDVLENRLGMAQAPALPPGHLFGMEVPDGGSACASCVSLLPGGRCGNPWFVQWAGTEVIPRPVNAYCCDVYWPRSPPSP